MTCDGSKGLMRERAGLAQVGVRWPGGGWAPGEPTLHATWRDESSNPPSPPRLFPVAEGLNVS